MLKLVVANNTQPIGNSLFAVACSCCDWVVVRAGVVGWICTGLSTAFITLSAGDITNESSSIISKAIHKYAHNYSIHSIEEGSLHKMLSKDSKRA